MAGESIHIERRNTGEGDSNGLERKTHPQPQAVDLTQQVGDWRDLLERADGI